MASSFGAALTAVMFERDMTDKEVGNAINTTPWTITKWRSGKTPCTEGFLRIKALFPEASLPTPRNLGHRGDKHLGERPATLNMEPLADGRLPAKPKANPNDTNVLCMIELCLEFQTNPQSAIQFIHALTSKALGK